MAQLVNIPPAMQEGPPATQESRVQSLGQEDPLEKEMATHSNILAWEKKNPIDRGAQWATVHEVARVRKDLETKPPPPVVISAEKKEGLVETITA